jgi:hypothetical protein
MVMKWIKHQINHLEDLKAQTVISLRFWLK